MNLSLAHRFSVIFLSCILFFSCKKDEETLSISDEIVQYLHVSHTRTKINPNIVEELESKDLSIYDMLWLGGDLASLSSADNETMEYLNSIFHFSNLNTLWALGNHDVSDLQRIKSFTNRPNFYSYFKNGITFLVLDTQESTSNIEGNQKELIENVTDTLSESSHLIVLHHKLIWMSGDEYLEPLISQVSNGELGTCDWCINPNNFYSDIYPKLIEVKQNGIEVICIGGDIGFKTSQFEYQTDEGIYFLASGLNHNLDQNKILVFYHNLTQKSLNWEFELLN